MALAKNLKCQKNVQKFNPGFTSRKTERSHSEQNIFPQSFGWKSEN